MSVQRQWQTPEGVALSLTLAPLGDRAVAFTVDALIVVALTLLLVWVALFAGAGRDLFVALILLLSFVLRTGYFAGFEWAWRGQTPGKRWLGLRVVAAEGGGLSPRAVLARNLTRELETFLPLVLLAAPEQVYGPIGPGLGLLSVLWILALVGLPFFNREGARVGDLIGGTRVVRVPAGALLEDLSEGSRAGGWVFAEAQLGHYGERELHVLEEVLRGGPAVDAAVEQAVARRIAARIGHPAPAEARAFLQAFYTAQRAQLERARLWGRPTADRAAARARIEGP